MAFLKVLTLFLVLFVFSMEANSSAVHGVFKVVKGKVLIKSKSGKTKRARIGMKVLPQDSIKTEKDSRAKIVMTDKNIINVSPESVVVLSQYEFDPKKDKKKVLINVIYGKIRSKVSQKYEGKNKFQVKTPSAVAGVRGTDFLTSFDRQTGQSQVVTFEGLVEFGLPTSGGEITKSVMVDVGKTSSLIGSNTPSLPAEIPVAELKKFNTETDADSALANSEPNNQNLEPESKPQDDKREPATDNDGRSPDLNPGGDDAGLDGPGLGGADMDGPKLGDPSMSDDNAFRGPDSIGDSMLMPDDLVAESDQLMMPDTDLMTEMPDNFTPPDVYEVPDCGQACIDSIEGTRRLIINVQHQ